jgi:hypothetical protein
MLSQDKFFKNILLGLGSPVMQKKPCRPDVRLDYKKERPGMDAGTCTQMDSSLDYFFAFAFAVF